MRSVLKTTAMGFLAAGLLAAFSGCESGPKGKVWFVTPKKGETVKGPVYKNGDVQVKVKMGVEGMKIRPAGTKEKDTGHHHIIVNGGPIKKGTQIIANKTHIHYGLGQTEAKLRLPQGKNRLTLQFADYAHVSYGPKWSETIEITVEKGEGEVKAKGKGKKKKKKKKD